MHLIVYEFFFEFIFLIEDNYFSILWCCLVAQLCLILCNPMDCSMPVLSVPHHLPKFAEVCVHCIGDAIQPSHPLTFSPPSALLLPLPSNRTFPMSQLFASDNQKTGISASASVLPRSIRGWSLLRLTGLISLLSKGLPGVFSSTMVFEGIRSSVLQLLYSPALTTVHDHWEDHRLDYTDFCWQSNVSALQHTV